MTKIGEVYISSKMNPGSVFTPFCSSVVFCFYVNLYYVQEKVRIKIYPT